MLFYFSWHNAFVEKKTCGALQKGQVMFTGWFKVQINVLTTLPFFFLQFLVSKDKFENLKCTFGQEFFSSSKSIFKYESCFRGISNIGNKMIV